MLKRRMHKYMGALAVIATTSIASLASAFVVPENTKATRTSSQTIQPTPPASELQASTIIPAEYKALFQGNKANVFMNNIKRKYNDDDWFSLLLSSVETATPTTTTSILSFLQNTFAPILSASFLITSSTVGAGMLVLPELTQGHMSTSLVLFGIAHFVNLLSGLLLAHVTITQHEQHPNHAQPQQQSSFKELARTNLHSSTAANMISIISMSVNMAICAFDIDRVGEVLQLSNNANDMLPHSSVVSILWAALFGTLLSTSPLSRLGQVASMCAAALFVSFAGLLLPNICLLWSDAATILPDTTTTTISTTTDGLMLSAASDPAAIMSTVFPVMLMSLVFQNVVPAVTHMLSYDRTKTACAIGLGSAIPLAMYVSWCLVCSTAAATTSTAAAASGWLLTAFSLATLAGSTLGTGMSIAGELATFFKNDSSSSTTTTTSDAKEQTVLTTTSTSGDAAAKTRMAQQRHKIDKDGGSSGGHPWALSALTLGLPLTLALTYGGDLTEVLSLAGSLGSPLLYGVVPVVMAWNQRSNTAKREEPVAQAQLQPALAAMSVPALLGASGLAIVGQEVAQRMGQVVPI